MSAIEKKIIAINEMLGSKVFSADEKKNEIDIDTGCGYCIYCDDRQDMFTTLELMLEGMRIMQMVKGA